MQDNLAVYQNLNNPFLESIYRNNHKYAGVITMFNGKKSV